MTTETANGDIVVPQKRLFVAILPDPAWSEALVRTQQIIAPQLRRASRTLPANIHLTLEFLGPCGPAEEHGAREVLLDVAQRHVPFALTLGDVGAFAKRRGAILWRGIQIEQAAASPGSSQVLKGPSELYALQRDLVATLARQRALESRIDVDAPYVPHITLFRQARVVGTSDAAAGNDVVALDALLAKTNDELMRLGDSAFPTMNVSSVSLMWSHHPTAGAPLAYDAIATERL